MKTTKLNRIVTGGIGFALAYFGYAYLKGFNGESITNIQSVLNTVLTTVTTCNHTLALVWIVGIGFVSFCKLFGLDGPVFYGVWCVIRAFFKLFKDLFLWMIGKGANPIT